MQVVGRLTAPLIGEALLFQVAGGLLVPVGGMVIGIGGMSLGNHERLKGFQRFSAVDRAFRTVYCARGARLSLPKKLKGSIIVSTPPGIWGMLV
jgi:hypothetical protein